MRRGSQNRRYKKLDLKARGLLLLRKYDVENDKEEEIGRIEVQKIQEIEIVENGGGAKHVEVSEDVAIQEGDKQVSTKEISQDPEKEKEWLDVSPGKSSRPPTPLKFGQVSILTKSRFEVLSPMEEQEAIEDENLEQTEEEHER
ncbi:hypothetical protein F2Q69_00042107 [Brassica cretica]|uniref:Uncharacterized protein n=1 Tax=Brassica cretica TaxID=69181 RepID=A0A8S9NGF8_BRACR|nr:hypothetical protein F2Q69_00042107 [Brassica cretica]